MSCRDENNNSHDAVLLHHVYVCLFIVVFVDRPVASSLSVYVISASLGSSVTLPCLVSLSSTPSSSSSPAEPRVKWTVVSGGVETQILVARGQRVKINEAYRERAALSNYTSSSDDLSLWLADLRTTDSGHYRCEVQQGLEDAADLVQLKTPWAVMPFPSVRPRQLVRPSGLKLLLLTICWRLIMTDMSSVMQDGCQISPSGKTPALFQHDINPFMHSGHSSGQLFKAVFLYIHGFCCFSSISANTMDAYASFHTLTFRPLL
uniref:Ig-like domain-containing protein n=1 Tax=Sphaeramia orbicularis TaxID=375764 RepID=A0A672Z7A8_9TELE